MWTMDGEREEHSTNVTSEGGLFKGTLHVTEIADIETEGWITQLHDLVKRPNHKKRITAACQMKQRYW